MIDRIVIANFKSLRRVDLRLGRMNLFIGANASGKSNFLDALRLLQGIGNGFTINEILDGKPKSATSDVWAGIRGGSARACFSGAGHEQEISIKMCSRWDPLVPWDTMRPEDPRLKSLETGPDCALEVAFLPAVGKITREHFSLGGHTIYRFAPGTASNRHAKYHSGTPRNGSFSVEENRPILEQFTHLYHNDLFDDLPREHPDLASRAAKTLANMQRLDPSPAQLRRYSDAPNAQHMGDHGENFAALVQGICKDEKVKEVYLSWLRELRPEQIDDVGVLRGAVDEPLFMLRENGRAFPATVLSDGTLRFAAVAAAFFQPEMPNLITMEEIENGIHANRLRTLLDLLRTQAEETGTQIIATTHSAAMLDWLDEKDYETTFLCTRDEATCESHIRPLATMPHFLDIVRKTPPSELFTEGWLETVP